MINNGSPNNHPPKRVQSLLPSLTKLLNPVHEPQRNKLGPQFSPSQRLVAHRDPGDNHLRVHLRDGDNREHKHVHSDRAQQVNAHGHQLLSVQPGRVRPVAARLGPPSRDLHGLVQVSLRVRRGFLHSSRVSRRDIDQRLCPHNHGVHCREIPGHMSPVLVANHVQADQGGETDPRRVAGGSVVRFAPSVAVRSRATQGASGGGDVHGEEDPAPTLLRTVHLPVLRRPDEPHHRALRFDRFEAKEVEHDEEEQRERDGRKLQASDWKVVEESAEDACCSGDSIFYLLGTISRSTTDRHLWDKLRGSHILEQRMDRVPLSSHDLHIWCILLYLYDD